MNPILAMPGMNVDTYNTWYHATHQPTEEELRCGLGCNEEMVRLFKNQKDDDRTTHDLAFESMRKAGYSFDECLTQTERNILKPKAWDFLRGKK